VALVVAQADASDDLAALGLAEELARLRLEDGEPLVGAGGHDDRASVVDEDLEEIGREFPRCVGPLLPELL
jgi:hypothetical protein